jgi:hypothetical protein
VCEVDALTTLHLFGVARRRVGSALAAMALHRRHLATTPGCTFWKLLGTGAGRTFDLRDADPRTWGLLAVWRDAAALADFERRSPVAAAWSRLADTRWRADLRPLGARGTWSGMRPFSPGDLGWRGPVAAITRARLRPSRMGAFWSAVPPVAADLRGRPGLRLAVGIGEAPVGVQGTFSLWDSAEALAHFAYRGAAHREVIRRTPVERWYAEELFARFAVLQTTGRLPARFAVLQTTGRLPAR